MIFWSRTEDGWAVNLDGTDATTRYALPRIELRSSARGWACACHMSDGTSLLVPLRDPVSAAEARRRAIQGSLAALGGEHAPALRRLMFAPFPRG